MRYAEKLKHPKWQKKRLQILNRDKWKCKKCGDTETTLHVHHLKYDGDPWNVENKYLVTLCEDCHTMVESNNIELFERVKIFKKYSRINGQLIVSSDVDGITISIRKKTDCLTFYLNKENAYKVVKVIENSYTIPSIKKTGKIPDFNEIKAKILNNKL